MVDRWRGSPGGLNNFSPHGALILNILDLYKESYDSNLVKNLVNQLILLFVFLYEENSNLNHASLINGGTTLSN